MDRKNLRPLYVEWIDSTSTHGWESIEDTLKMKENITCFTLGWLLHEDKNVIVMVLNYDLVDKDRVNHVNNSIVIPKVCITKRRNLKL